MREGANTAGSGHGDSLPHPAPRAAEDPFDRVAGLASRILQVPAVVVTLIQDGVERIVGRAGPRPPLDTAREFPISSVARPPGILVVRDVRRDHRVREAGALGRAGVIACVAVPLRRPGGEPAGALCAIDYLPRHWGSDEVRIVEDLAALIEADVRLRLPRTASGPEAPGETERLRVLVEQPPVGLFVMEGGEVTFVNPVLADLLGLPRGEPGRGAPPVLFGEEEVRRIESQLRESEAGTLSFCTVVPRAAEPARPVRLEVRLRGVALGDGLAVVGAAMDPEETARYAEEAWRPEERLRRVFEDAPDGIAVADPGGTILACNPQFVRIAGYPSVEAALGESLLRLGPEPGRFDELVRQIRYDRIAAREELDLVRRDGAIVRVVAEVSGTFDDAGEPTEIRVYLLDVTQRARTEEALRASDERLRLVELATNDVLWDWNLSTGELTWNGAGPRRFRYAPEEFRRSIEWHAERIHPDDRERVIRGLHAAINGVGDAWTGEYRFRRGDETYASVLDRAYVVRNRRGEAVRVIGWMLDVTQWRLSEESHRFLARASAMLDSSLDFPMTLGNLARVCVPDLADYCMVDVLEEDGGIRRVAVTHAQPRRERHLGRDAYHPPGSDAAIHPVIEVVRTGEPLLAPDCGEELSGRLAAASGDAVGKLGLRSLMIVPLSVHDRVIGAVTLASSESGRRYLPVDLVVARDLAQRAALAIANAQLFQTAERALQAREEVLGVVSHDLRGPLNTIMTTASLLLETERERREGIRRWLEIIERAAEHMNSLIGDLLDVSSMEAGHFSLNRSLQDIQAVASGACEMLQPLAEAKRVGLVCRVEEGLGEIWLDSRQLQRVLTNLIGNAIKFTATGGTIEIRVRRADAVVRFEVEDTGPGIPAGQIPRIFDRFWQGRVGDRRGAGLGLTIAKGIVEAHGGHIGVESREGAGSTFFFELPVEAPAPAEQAAAAAGEPASPADGDAAPDLPMPPAGEAEAAG